MSKFYTSLSAMKLTLLICSVVFLCGSGTLLAYQSTEPPRDGTTQLNLSQTINGITVTVSWIYVDDQTIRLHYEIKTEKLTIAKLVAKGAQLKDHQGNYFSASSVSSSFIATVDGNHKAIFDRTYQTQGYYRPGQNFNQLRNRYEAQGEIDLIFEVQISDPFVLESVSPESTAEVTLSPLTPGISATPQPILFHFEFRVPFYSSTIVEPNQTVTVNNLAVTLQRVEISPEITILYICYNENEANRWGMQKPVFQLGNQIPFFYGYSRLETCDQFTYDIPYDGTPVTLSFEIPYFQNTEFSQYSLSQTDWDQIKVGIEAQGIKLEPTFDTNGYFTGVKLALAPADVDLWAVVEEELYAQGLIQRIYGPWKFTVEINTLDQ